MESFSESVLLSIQQNSEWAWLIVFVVAFIESLAIVGLFLPGYVLLVGIGALIGLDVLNFMPMAISAYCGAVLGEYLSYYLGYHYHEVILKWPLIARRQTLINATRVFFDKHGATGVFFGRFLGPIRAVIPLVAGIAEMPKRTFFWVNIFSGLIWAPLYLIYGILIGAAVNIDQEMSLSFLMVVIVISVVCYMAIKQTKKLGAKQNNQNYFFVWLNVGLSWSMFIMILVVVSKSIYFEFAKKLLLVVLDKIT
jgi:membrane protein DedA with SNARE-associated domain